MDDIKILVVEDDPEINQLVCHALVREGYTADSVYNGRDAILKASENSYQLMVLDLMIPLVDGGEVLRRIREGTRMPVVILSAKCEESDKIIGLGLGADDYMTKPFSVGELTARVKAQLRRFLYFSEPLGEAAAILKHMDLEMDLRSHRVAVAGRQVMLTAKEFDILKLFMSSPRRVFTKTHVLNAVWGGNSFNDENIIMVHIRRLREKIEADPSNPKYIQTVWGIGYKLSEA